MTPSKLEASILTIDASRNNSSNNFLIPYSLRTRIILHIATISLIVCTFYFYYLGYTTDIDLAVGLLLGFKHEAFLCGYAGKAWFPLIAVMAPFLMGCRMIYKGIDGLNRVKEEERRMMMTTQKN